MGWPAVINYKDPLQQLELHGINFDPYVCQECSIVIQLLQMYMHYHVVNAIVEFRVVTSADTGLAFIQHTTMG